MAAAPKILAFAGSTRTGSFNKKLIKIAAGGAKAAGADVTTIDLRDFPMPIYDGYLEEKSGIPENAKKLKKLFLENQGLLIASPEYNSSITGVLKNAIDWVSREETDDEPALACFKGKIAALVAASPGALGGLRGLYHVREILANITVLVLSSLVTVSRAHEAFDPDGNLKDSKKQQQVEKQGADLADALKKMTR